MLKKKEVLIYIAGALNADAVYYIQNLHRMIKWDIRIRDLGFSTFCPGYDFLGGLVAGYWLYKDYFGNNQAILSRCDAVFLVPGYNRSKGTNKEITEAFKLNIPVFHNTGELMRYFDKRTNND